MLPIIDYNSAQDRQVLTQRLARVRGQIGDASQVADQVAVIVEEVRQNGDAAVVRYMRQWTDPAFSTEKIRVKAEELDRAARALPQGIKEAFTRSIEHVRAYQEHIKPADPPLLELDGAQLGLRFTPIQNVGLHVPGGKAAYPSSVIMLGVPAQVAGVGQLAVVSPPPTGGGSDISPLVLGVCGLLGIDRVYRIGGAQAIAALAYGTESVPAVDFIAGPGNAYTQQAKRQLFGIVGIDGLFGPSEIVILADESANPDYIAADLLAQAEHDPGCCFLVSRSGNAITAIRQAVWRQLGDRKRRAAIEPALRDWSAAILVPDEAACIEVVDAIAAEHVTLAVADPQSWLKKLSHGGAWFLGDQTPVASGDYYAGPSHCLPTGTTARFSSGLSVYTFLKRSSVEMYPAGLDPRTIADIAAFAEAEGLDGHAASVRIRQRK